MNCYHAAGHVKSDSSADMVASHIVASPASVAATYTNISKQNSKLRMCGMSKHSQLKSCLSSNSCSRRVLREIQSFKPKLTVERETRERKVEVQLSLTPASRLRLNRDIRAVPLKLQQNLMFRWPLENLVSLQLDRLCMKQLYGLNSSKKHRAARPADAAEVCRSAGGSPKQWN